MSGMVRTRTAEMDDHDRRRLPAALRQLFADGGAGRMLPYALPPGSVVWPDPGYTQHQTAKRPALWLSDEPVTGELWSRLRTEHRRSGLWPLLLDDTAQPWSAGQIAPEPVADIANYDPAAFMAEVWADWLEPLPAWDEAEELAPFGRSCPGLAPPGDLVEDPDLLADRHARILAERDMQLGLTAVGRSADTLAAIGWQGALNHNPWTAPMSAVIRTWEDRFGVRVVAMGFNTLDLSVAAPPVTVPHALLVAAEHWAFCPDNIVQGPGDLVGYAEHIRGRRTWSFWWD